MKSGRVSTKAALAFIVTLILAASLSITAFAAERYENCGNAYGRIIPTDEKLEAQVFDYYFTGDSAPVHFMRMSTGTPGACYAVEIYADAEYTTLIKYLSREYDSAAGHTPVAINLSFDGLRSGTYYGRCYTYVTREDGTIYDLDSIQNFNIHIDRLSTKTVVLSGANNTDAGINVTWTPNATATQYHVYRKVNYEADWVYVATLGEGSYNYVDTDVVNGYTYTYTVRCSDGGYSSGFDSVGVTAVRLSTPTLNYVAIAGYQGYANVNWLPVEGADGYYVYRKGGSLSSYEWKLIAEVQGGYSTNYIDTTSTSTNWSYNYTVVAYKGGSVSSYNPAGLEFNFMNAPVLTNAVSTEYGVYLEWYNGNRKAEGFNVYRRAWDGNWELIGSTTEAYFTDTTAASGIDYVYTVSAFCSTNESAYSIDGIGLRYVAAPQLNDVWFDEYNTAVVSWNYVGGAERYQVFRKLSYEYDWTLIGETYDTYFYDSIEKYSGESYTYTVIAFSGNYGSSYDSVGKTGYFLAAPWVNAYNVYSWGASGVQVDWGYVNGAATYDVYRSDYGVDNWVCIAAGLTSSSYVDYTANAYGGYSYAVIAVNGYSYGRYNTSSVIALPTPALEYAVIGSEGGIHLGWSALADGTVYHIYRRPVDGSWVEIGTSTTNYFADWSEEAVNQYFVYTVSAELYGYMSSFDGTGIANYTEVRNLSGYLTEGEVPYITVNWELDGYAQWYELIKTVNGQSVSLGVFAGDSWVTQYVDTDVSIGNVYTYSVVAGCEGRFSKTNSTEVKYPLPPVPAAYIGGVNGYVNNGVGCIDIVWGFVDYAEIYTIYRRTEGTEWVALATVSASDLVNGPIYTDTTADFDVTYYYTVVGYAYNRESYFDNTGVAGSVLRPVSHPYGVTVREDILNTQTVAVVGWDAVDKAEYYSVFRKENNGEWMYLGTIWDGSCSFIDYTVVQGVKYTYTVSAGATGRGEAFNPVGATYRWNIYDVGLVPEDYTGLFEYAGNWYYFENGRINWYSDTLVNHEGYWYYTYLGEVAWDYTGLVSYNDNWYYVENGVVNFNATTLVYFNNEWYYVENGSVNWNADTLVYFGDCWYYVSGGIVKWDYTGLVCYYDVWYYVENGAVNFGATTLALYYDNWYYVENGIVNFYATTLVYFNGEWYYVENGTINWNADTLVYFGDCWYYVNGGIVNWDYTGLVCYYDVWYYVENGSVNFNATTLVSYYDVWYYVENGAINWDATTLVYFNNEWYYVENGTVNWSADTLVYFADSWYYVNGGIVNWNYTGLVCYYDNWYYVENGYVSFSTTTLVEYNGKWFYVENSFLNWGREAVVSYNGARYYVLNSEVAFWFSGNVVLNGISYAVFNGVVQGMPYDTNPVY